MKKLIIFAIILTACSSAGVRSDEMQPDGSYKIYSTGNAYASRERVMNTAKFRAQQICPKGYTQKSAYCDDDIKIGCTMIVVCD